MERSLPVEVLVHEDDAVTVANNAKGPSTILSRFLPMIQSSLQSYFSSLAFSGCITVSTGSASLRSVLPCQSIGNQESASVAWCSMLARGTTSNPKLGKA